MVSTGIAQPNQPKAQGPMPCSAARSVEDHAGKRITNPGPNLPLWRDDGWPGIGQPPQPRRVRIRPVRARLR